MLGLILQLAREDGLKCRKMKTMDVQDLCETNPCEATEDAMLERVIKSTSTKLVIPMLVGTLLLCGSRVI